METEDAVAGAQETSTLDEQTTKGGSNTELEDVRLSSLFVSILNVVKTCIGAGILSYVQSPHHDASFPSANSCENVTFIFSDFHGHFRMARCGHRSSCSCSARCIV